MDWETHELSYWLGTQKCTLRGDQSIQLKNFAMDVVSVVFQVQTFETSNEQSCEVSHEIRSILEEFMGVFAEPKQLPPNRGFEHSINLVPCTKPI